MANSGPNRPAGADYDADARKTGMDELRNLLLAPERAELDELQERIQNPSRRAADLSEVLPEAILLRAARDQRLTLTLEPLLEKALANSVRKNPGLLAETLFPIIAGAVRRAVASALQGLMESLNQVVETSISMRSVGWRLEAARTGKSYAEIALLRSLLYRVEQVFLIQNETGLLLQHVSGDSVEARDPDMVSGMLTAIQNFVQDSFGAADHTLETVRVGEFSVWIEHGPKALLASVIRGTPPLKLREVFDAALDSIHQDYAAQLSNYSGDPASLEGARPALESCLLGQSPPGQRASRLPFYAAAFVLIAGLALWAGIRLRDTWRWQHYLALLRQEPGVVVLHDEHSGSRYRISGLRDPLSRDPSQLLRAAKIPPSHVSSYWEPYQSLAPRLVALRAFVDSKSRLEQQVIHFDTRKADLSAAARDSLRTIAGLTKSLAKSGETLGQDARVEIVGHTDEQGTAQINDQLGLDRAAAVKSALIALGADGSRLDVKTVGSREPLQTGAGDSVYSENRSVSFRVETGSGK